MSTQDLKSKAIGTATSSVEPLFNYKLIVRVFFYLAFPLALIAIACNRSYIKQQKRWIQEKENKKRAKENKLK
jgi:cell division protein FtsW (lipid II flippase)